MLSLFDAKWATLAGGYRAPYDPSAALSKLEQGQDVWPELWDELHHQRDVGEPSYAAVPHLVRIARKSNPPVPAWLADDYFVAMRGMQGLALSDLPLRDDSLTVQAILAALALCRRQPKLGALLYQLAWDELYESDGRQ